MADTVLYFYANTGLHGTDESLESGIPPYLLTVADISASELSGEERHLR